MDIYSFKNNKKYVKFLYYFIVLVALSNVINFAFLDRFSSAAFAAIIGFFIFIVVRSYNTENIYLDEHEMKAGVAIPYMLISKIEVIDSKVEIAAEDGRKATIKMIDAESNFDKYKEMLDKLFEKAGHHNENITGSSGEILSNIIENRKVFPEKDGIIELGGWLKFIKTISTIMIVLGAIFLVTVLVPFLLIGMNSADSSTFFETTLQVGISFVFSIIVLVMLKKRKKNVMYAIVAMNISNSLYSIILSVNNNIINMNTNFNALQFISVNLLLVINTVLYALIVLDYFKNSNRANYTLLNK